MVKITINENEQNQRVDRFLKKYFDNAPLSLIYRIIRKDLKVNGKRVKEDTILNLNDELTIYMLEEEVKNLQKERKIVKAKKQFKIAYEDSNILIAEKPFGLLTHGDKLEKKNHLQNQVLDYLIENKEYNPRENKTFTPSPANRLDRNTTGLVLFAKNSLALQELNKLVKDKDMIEKHYMTIVSNKVEAPLKLVARMEKDEHNNLVSITDNENGKLMETIVSPILSKKYKDKWYTLLDVRILTGRTHQIRVQLKDAGLPIIGDVKYGDQKINKIFKEDFHLNTQLLHAYKLVFNKMKDDSILNYMEGKEIISSLPDDFSKIKEVIFDGRRK